MHISFWLLFFTKLTNVYDFYVFPLFFSFLGVLLFFHAQSLKPLSLAQTNHHKNGLGWDYDADQVGLRCSYLVCYNLLNPTQFTL